MTLSISNYFLKSPNTITQDIRASIYEFWTQGTNIHFTIGGTRLWVSQGAGHTQIKSLLWEKQKYVILKKQNQESLP